MAKKNKIKYIKTNYFRHVFCLLFSCGTFFIIALLIFLKHKSIDIYTLTDIINHSFPQVIILGAIGYLMGIIIDNPKKAMMTDYKDLIYEELIKSNQKITQDELNKKLEIHPPESDEERENYPFEDGEMNIGESEVKL